MVKPILLCRVDGNFGGVERYILTLSKELDPQRYQPVIACIANHGELLRQAKDIGIETEFIPMKSRLAIRQSARSLANIARQRNAALIHTFGLRSNSIAWWMQKQHRTPWIVRLPNINSTDYNNALRGGLSHWANNYFIRKADALQVISPQLEKYVRGWKKPPKSIHTIFNGVDVNQYDPSTVDRSIRNRYNLPDNAIVLGSVGRLERIKGYDLLIRAVAHIHGEYPNIHLMLVGDGPERDSLFQLSKKLHVEENVIITGFQEDVRSHLKAFDLYICSSHSEGVPMAMLEAMSMELPVISTRVGGIESVITEKTGLLIQPSHEESMYNAIRSMLSKHGDWEEIGKSARMRAIERFSVSTMVNNVHAMYDKILKTNTI